MGMKAVDNGGQGINRGGRIGIQTDRIIFYGINLMFLLPALKKGSPIGLAAAGVLLLALFAVLMYSGRGSEPASGQMTILVFFDALIQLALHYESLLANFHADYPDRMASAYTQRPLCIALIGLGAVLGLVGLWLRLFWLVSLSGAVLETAVILSFWSNGSLRDFQLFTNGGKAIAAFWLWAFIWTLLSRVVLFAAPKKWTLHIFLSILLLCIAAALHLLEPRYVRSLVAEPLELLLTWEQVIFICAVLLGCSLAMAKHGREWAIFDSLTLLACAIFIFAAKYLSCTYFLGSWLFFLLLTGSMLQCLKNTAADNTTLGLRPLSYMILQTAVFFISAKAFQLGLYANVILAVITGLLLWSQRIKKEPEEFQDFFCGTMITFFAAEALAWQWRMRFSGEGMILVAVVFVMTMVVLLLVSLPHPEGLRAPKSMRIWVCACAGILCLLSMVPTLWIQSEVRASESYIEVKALNGAVAAEVSYCWKDWRGQVVEEAELKGSQAVLPVKGYILTVTAVDERGIRSSRDFWYPILPYLL